jgi:hypothetical protein
VSLLVAKLGMMDVEWSLGAAYGTAPRAYRKALQEWYACSDAPELGV